MTSKETAVRTRLAAVFALIEIASVALLYVLAMQKATPDTAGLLLILLLPIAFGLHVTEEFICPGGFISWDNIYRPNYVDTPGSFYVKINAIPGVASLLVVLGAFDYTGTYSFFGIRAWLAFLTFLACNAFFHVRGALHTRTYSPGMVTGVLIFLPLTVLSYIHFLSSGAVDGISALLCVAFALLVQPVLDAIKTHGLKQAYHSFSKSHRP